MLDEVQFYNELSYNIRLRTFLKEKQLSRLFIPIATFNQDHVNQEEEFVAMIEGSYFPFYGLAWSIEKVQYNFDLTMQSNIDTSRHSVLEAQRIGNLFVDEARLNANKFRKSQEEKNLLISNFDFAMTDRDFTDDNSDETQIVELYLFE